MKMRVWRGGRNTGGTSRKPLTPSSFRILVATSIGVVIWVIWLSGMLGDSRRVTLFALSEVAILGIGLVIALRRGYQAEATARAANEAKSRFLATMSHELRTPLNAIIGFSELMENQRLGPIGNEKYRSYATDIHVSGTQLLQLIDDILDLSKIEAGELVLQEDVFEIRQMAEAVVRINRGEVEKAGLTLTVDLPTDLPLLRADERRTRQVLFNLIGNAIKFTPEGGRIDITARFDPRAGLRIAVADTGIGIAPEYLPRVFEPFMQVDNSLSRQHAGTGLGLPTAEAIMKLHGGALELTSTVGHGTQVVMFFPWERLVRREQHPTPKLSVA
jgi:signal transduction histidine kinase